MFSNRVNYKAITGMHSKKAIKIFFLKKLERFKLEEVYLYFGHEEDRKLNLQEYVIDHRV